MFKKNGVSDVKRSERDKRNSVFQGWQTDWKHSTYQRVTKTPVLRSILQSSKWQQSLCKDLDGQNACQLGCQRLKNEMIPLCRELLKYGCKKGFTRGGKHLKSDLKCTELCQWFGHSSNGKPCWFIAYLTLVSEKIYWLILTTATYRVEHCMKNEKYGLSLIHIFLYLDRISDSVQIQENTDTILSIYGKTWIKESLYLGIFHSVEFSVTLLNGSKLLTDVTKSSC